MDQEKIGRFIAQLRRQQGWTQQQLADALGVNSRSVSRWETGKTMPDLSLLQPLAQALGASVAELLNGCRAAPEDVNAVRAAMQGVLECSAQEKRRLARRQSLHSGALAACYLLALADSRFAALGLIFQPLPATVARNALYGLMLAIILADLYRTKWGVPLRFYRDLLMKRLGPRRASG